MVVSYSCQHTDKLEGKEGEGLFWTGELKINYYHNKRVSNISL